MKKYIIYLLIPEFHEEVKQLLAKFVEPIPEDYKIAYEEEALNRLRIYWLNKDLTKLPTDHAEHFKTVLIPKHKQIIVEDTGNRTLGNSVVVLVDEKEQSLRELPIFNFAEWSKEREENFSESTDEGLLPEQFKF